MFFKYGEKEIDYLKQKDKYLAEVIERVGKVEREVDTDLFSSVVHHIVGQQISTKAQATIWKKLNDNLGSINADTISNAGIEYLQSFGMTFKKAKTDEFLIIKNFYWNLIDVMIEENSKIGWKKGIYPIDAFIQNSLIKGELFTLKENGKLLSCVIINNCCNEGYKEVNWSFD